jgi:hypothetical protein
MKITLKMATTYLTLRRHVQAYASSTRCTCCDDLISPEQLRSKGNPQNCPGLTNPHFILTLITAGFLTSTYHLQRVNMT